MKIMNLIQSGFSYVKEKAVNAGKVAAAALALAVGGSVPAEAAVSFDALTQSFAGTFDLTPYYTAIGIIVVAIAIVAGIKLGLRGFKSVG